MSVVQLDLFDTSEPVAASAAPKPIVLNGMYYERSTDKFVSFARGQRYYEEPAKRCGHSKEWQERIKRQRSI